MKYLPSSAEDKSISSDVSSKQHSETSTVINGDQPKMRYRCKLCGQPKQNHTCPYQQSLQRSIGVTVYPSVNAFTACEPGYLTPALSEMNNFVNGQDSIASDITPSRPDRGMTHHPTAPMMVLLPGIPPRNVSPESLRSAIPHQGSSPLSTLSHTPRRNPFQTGTYRQYPSSKINIRETSLGCLDGRRKRILSPGCGASIGSNSTNTTGDRLFADATELRPEQYRIVSTSVLHDSFSYPLLPLPYTQRKSLSDNLFSLSKGIPQLTDECASVLRKARECDMWDIAVAELMTQVIVVIHCPENDRRLDGLSAYLLSLGFAC